MKNKSITSSQYNSVNDVNIVLKKSISGSVIHGSVKMKNA